MVSLVILGVIILVGLVSGTKLVETVEKGTYQVKQAAITGNMTAKMDPGMWGQFFGDIVVWPKAETYFFTSSKDTKGDTAIDKSIEVRFNDGSLCNIGGTLRIILPTSESEAISLVTARGHKKYIDAQEKLVLPHVRNVLRTTANLMSARESYSTKRSQFVTWSRDQIQNGVYQTETEIRPEKDLVSGETIMKSFQKIKEIDGLPQYQANPLEGTGILVKQFEVKKFKYEEKVRKQIAKQQEALMAVATAKAKAAEAEQDKLTIVAQGKAKVASAKYEEEQKKVRAVVEAQKNKEVQELNADRDKNVAETQANKRLEVAKLDRKAAVETKEEQILLGEGEATRKQLVLAADGALAQKLKTYEAIMDTWANAYSKRKVPTIIMGGSGTGPKAEGSVDSNAIQMADVLSLMALKQLGLNLDMPTGSIQQGKKIALK